MAPGQLRALGVVGAVVAMLLLQACGEDKLVRSPCREDSDCESGLLCEASVCIDAASKSCEVVTEGNPILQPSPHRVLFGELETPEVVHTVMLHNLGNCTLTLFEAAVEQPGDGEKAFVCETCEGSFPIEIFPGRARELPVRFRAPGVGGFDASLVLLSDDREFPELRIPLHARFNGVPELRVAPDPVDFGYVAQGRVLKKVVQVTNQGSGVASLELQKIALEPEGTQHFSVSPPLDAPLALPPVREDRSAILALDVQYHPRSVGVHKGALVLTTNKGTLRVELSGNSETPPKLNVSPTSVDLGQVPLGQSNFQAVTLVNEGGAPLTVKAAWGGAAPTTDLFTVPSTLPAIAPGAYVELQVAVTATKVGPITGLLVLTTNDPSQPSITIPVSATGVPGNGPEVVKLELVYENGSDSAFDNDLRNVDLTLEHPFGYVCNKGTPQPKNWGAYGNPSWLAFAPKEEPERIVLADATQDGTYRVMLQFIEDCRSLPTDLAAGLLGISVEALVDVLGKGVISVDGKDVGELIAKTCVQRGASNATVRVYVNGTLKGEKTVQLGRKGDSVYALDLVRLGGTFSVK